MRITGPFVTAINLNNNFIILLFLSILTISSAIGVVYIKHKKRMLNILLQNIYLEQSKLNTEWSKLVLEKSTLMSNFRLETIAKEQLGMGMPKEIEFIGY